VLSNQPPVINSESDAESLGPESEEGVESPRMPDVEGVAVSDVDNGADEREIGEDTPDIQVKGQGYRNHVYEWGDESEPVDGDMDEDYQPSVDSVVLDGSDLDFQGQDGNRLDSTNICSDAEMVPEMSESCK
jgi:hypothetical protein